MNDLSDNSKKKWVLLEHIPPIITPKVLFLFLVYSMAFTLLLIGLKLFHLESKAKTLSNTSETQTTSDFADTIYENESALEIQQNIANNIIRLHVIANSDTEADQSLKLKVRDGIIEQLQTTLSHAATVEQAEELIATQSSDITAQAEQIIASNGYNYNVTVTLKDRYFPVKSYGDLIFPAGTYKALCVEIGSASGRNWWCVLFPSLCFVDDTTAVVPDDSKAKLKENLSDEEYESLEDYKKNVKTSTHSTNKVETHFAIYEWLKNHF